MRKRKDINSNKLKETEMSDQTQAELPRYRSLKKIWALQIKNIEQQENGDAILTFEEPYAPVVVTNYYLAVNDPGVGGYYIIREGESKQAYMSIDEFEEGHARI